MIDSWADLRSIEEHLAEDDVETRWAMAMFLFGEQRRDEMRRRLEEIVAIDPTHDQAHRMLGHELRNGTWYDDDGQAVGRSAPPPRADDDRRVAQGADPVQDTDVDPDPDTTPAEAPPMVDDDTGSGPDPDLDVFEAVTPADAAP